jgi:hypothetical protein
MIDTALGMADTSGQWATFGPVTTADRNKHQENHQERRKLLRVSVQGMAAG